MPNNKGIRDASLPWGTLSMPSAEKCSAQHNQGAGARPETAMQATWGSGAGGMGQLRAALRDRCVGTLGCRGEAERSRAGPAFPSCTRLGRGWGQVLRVAGCKRPAGIWRCSWGPQQWWEWERRLVDRDVRVPPNPEFSSSQDDRENASKHVSQGR